MSETPLDPGGFAEVRDVEPVETIIRPLGSGPTPPAVRP